MNYFRMAVAGLWLGVFGSAPVHASSIKPFIINGTVVAKSGYPAVVELVQNKQMFCTGTLIGERVIITAAHCIPEKTRWVDFIYNNTTYSAYLTAHPDLKDYNTHDYDFALGLVSQKVKAPRPYPVGGKATKGTLLTILGYGCYEENGYLIWDGKLRRASVPIEDFALPEMAAVSKADIAACSGDSGGPALVMHNGKGHLLGVTSKSDFVDKTWSVRLDLPESQQFLKDFAATNSVNICGITAACP
jgi:hypothetical protein